MQTHLGGKIHAEIAWIKELFPDAGITWDVYDHFGLARVITVLLAHGIHSQRRRIRQNVWRKNRYAPSPSARRPIPSGRGLFDLRSALTIAVYRSVLALRWSGGGHQSVECWSTMAEPYKVANWCHR